MKLFKTKQGFTLIELLIVIAIIAVLAIALIGPISTGPPKARDAARLINLSAIATAIEGYNADFGQYPPSTGGCISTIFKDPSPPNDDVADRYFSQGVAGIPGDPSNERTVTSDVGGCAAAGEYYYQKYASTAPGQYALGTVMEIDEANNSDDTVAADLGPYVTDPSACATTCKVFLIIK